ncbi:ADP-ribosylation factor family protein [Medicago truncatula]|uniref:ADP-ribosylation factor family protein n=1 Tax=Medicago truncatula TaxID=3880 RepID=A0A072UM84_MEDTR|nr:ADP-ribosylation factor family protein [Medicago truncatula]
MGKKPCTNIVLRDESENLVDVTLWDSYSVQLMTFLTKRKDRGSVVLILTHAQCKLADNGKPNLCNNWSDSKLLINLKHPVVEAFRARLKIFVPIALLAFSVMVSVIWTNDTLERSNVVLRHEDLKGAPLLILANKQDLPEAVSSEELARYLDLKKLDERVYMFEAVSSYDGLGIRESAEWLVEVMERSKRAEMLRL